jgi:tetratricopeptide (TPR) repeat protein
MWGYDAWGHVAYVLFLDLHRALPWADQGWSYFHPPLHYLLGWVLAQAGSGPLLMRGLVLLGAAASLATAGLAAWAVREASPGRPGLALLAFASVAFLPVHLFVSAMPGNELTSTFLGSAAVASFIASERRAPAGALADARTGLLLGLALLAKFSGLVPLLAVLACLGLAGLRAARRGAGALPQLRRAALVGASALALAAPYYARNVAAFGTPFKLSRDFPLVAEVERDQPPGARSWLDYARFSPRALADPDPRAPHLLHSVWGSAYVNVWADVTRESDVAPTPTAQRAQARIMSRMAWLGVAPTALALAGALLAARDARRGRRRQVYLPLLALSALALAAFAAFAWRVPQWSALKAAYLLPLSLPWGAFTARGFEALAGRSARWPLLAALLAAALGAALCGLEGALLPRRADAPAAGAVHFYFGEYDAARRIYGRLAAGAGHPAWLENLAAVELAEGRAEQALRLYARAAGLAQASGESAAYRQGRLAVAAALAGDAEGALLALERALGEAQRPELLANRGALRAARGDLEGAARDLAAALAAEPEMVPAWLNLAELRERAGDDAGAQEARARAAEQACRAPRRYPYGLGTGEILEWGVGRRWLLLLEEEGVGVALPSFYRGACAALRAGAGRP